MGHVVNYAYRLYEQADWVAHFGAMTQPYLEEYHPEPFSRRFVRHLPGWYAQKHPDEDWAETFAVWLTPGLDWRADYGAFPAALAKLEYCDRTMAALRSRDPIVVATERDDDVSQLRRLARTLTTKTTPERRAAAARARRRAAVDLRRRYRATTRRDAGRAIARARSDPAAGARPRRRTCSAGPATFPTARGACYDIWPNARRR